MGRLTQVISDATLKTLGAAGLRRWLLGRCLPPAHERLAGAVQRPIDIRIDSHGVPHILAENLADLFFAQGYCHARDRLWQMEINRRTARGELAELLGGRALELDRFFRRLGFRRLAEREWPLLSEEVRTVLAGYAAGVNAYVEHHRWPVEFVALRKRPRRWEPIDSLAFGRYMGWTLTYNWETELIRQRLRDALGPAGAAALEPALTGLEGGASNAWAVSAGRSATGRPLLANDPHLRPRMPAIWYVAHLEGAGINIIGATLPGTIGVLMGHNQRVAWGITASVVDGQDLFRERPHPQQPGRFAFQDQWYDAEPIQEIIQVRGQKEPVIETVLCTRHGPLLNGTIGIPKDGEPLAVQSITAGNFSPATAVLALNRATDWPAFRAALAQWTFPPLNFVYADMDGTIAHKLAGQVPLRQHKEHLLPIPGWDGAHEWTGLVPFDDMPEQVNPSEGFCANANNRPAGLCPHFLSNDWMDPHRQDRVLELLRVREQHTLEDFQVMQGDLVSLPAQTFAQLLTLKLGKDEPLLAELAGWDGKLETDSRPGAIYQVFRRELLSHVYADLPAAMRDYARGQGVHELVGLGSVFHGRSTRLILHHLHQIDTATLNRVYRATLHRLGELLGPDPAGWRWGHLHRVKLGHVLGQASPLLDRLLRLNRGPFPIGGDLDTIAQSGVDPWHPYEAGTFCVSYRQVLDVGNWDAARFIIPTGQSGHPGSTHYDDMLEPWLRVEYAPLHFSRPAVEQATVESIHIRPT